MIYHQPRLYRGIFTRNVIHPQIVRKSQLDAVRNDVAMQALYESVASRLQRRLAFTPREAARWGYAVTVGIAYNDNITLRPSDIGSLGIEDLGEEQDTRFSQSAR